MASIHNNRKNIKKTSNRETTGLLLIIIDGLLLLFISVPKVAGFFSEFVRRIVLGTFGFMSFPILIALIMLGISFMLKMTLRTEIRYVIGVSVISFFVALILQLATSQQYLGGSFGEYIAAVYDSNNNFTGGGAFFGIFVYGVQAALTVTYSYVMYALAIIMTAFLMAKNKYYSKKWSDKDNDKQANPTYRFEKGVMPVQTVKPVADRSLFVDVIRPVAKPYESSSGGFSTLLDKNKPKNVQAYSTPAEKAKASLYNDVNPDKHSKAMNIFNEIKNNSMKDISHYHKHDKKNSFDDKSYQKPSIPPLVSLSPDIKQAPEEEDVDNNFKKPPKIVHFEQQKPPFPSIPVLPFKDVSSSFVGGEIINGDELSKKLADERAPVIPVRPVSSDNFDKRKSEPVQAKPRVNEEINEFSEPEPVIERPPIINGTEFTELQERKKQEQLEQDQRRQKIKEEFNRAKPRAIQPNSQENDEYKERSFSIDELSTKKEEPLIESEPKKTPTLNFDYDDEEAESKSSSFSVDFSNFDLNKARQEIQNKLNSINDEESNQSYEDESNNEKEKGLVYDDEEEAVDLSEKIYLNDDHTGYYNAAHDENKIQEREVVKPQPKMKQANQIKLDDYAKFTAMQEAKQEKPKPKKRTEKYVPPPLTLLRASMTNESEDFAADSQEKAQILEETLKGLKLPATVNLITRGPSVTRYELEMPPGIPVRRIQQFSKDIEYNLASNGRIRIETPIPGKRAVGIEVPNEAVDIVRLKEIIGSKEFSNSASALTLALGKDIAGSNILCPLEKMPHLLIAGATGSGKSACLNSIIVSILYKSSPDDARIILIDPKHVEFTIYKGLPHLLTSEIITDAQAALNAFKWLKVEMDRRYNLFRQHIVRNLSEYNKLDDVKNGDLEKLPNIVLIVDELAELMQSNHRKDLEEKIMSMAQLARAAGIHLILATQRPSVDVITGTIKSNLPSRVAFAVKSVIDSRTILDQAGADTLLGNGDMLYAPLGLDDPRRVQGAYVTNEEVVAIVNYIKENNTANFDEEFTDSLVVKEEHQETEIDAEESEYDPLMANVIKLIIETGAVSTTFIQRRFAVGYARASRIIDQMELSGFIGPLEGSKPRPVYITKEQFREIFGEDI